jgi:FtsZ-binding cell division protein ZapB
MENMEDRCLEKLEAGVERLLDAYNALKNENRELREKLASLDSRQSLFKERLDSLISKIEGSVSQ